MTFNIYSIAIMVFLIFIGIIFAEFGIIEHYYHKYSQINYEIEMLKEESKAQTARFEAAQKQANSSVSKLNKSAKSIMSEKVPQNCNAAIQWGIEQARGFQS